MLLVVRQSSRASGDFCWLLARRVQPWPGVKRWYHWLPAHATPQGVLAARFEAKAMSSAILGQTAW